jgi:hypothetical protein
MKSLASVLLLEYALAANTTLLCKCDCTRASILAVPACSVCTKNYCIEQKVCEQNQDMSNWSTSCFQRGSYKDEIMIWSFMIITGLMVVLALLKPWIKEFLRNQNIELPHDYAVLLDDE